MRPKRAPVSLQLLFLLIQSAQPLIEKLFEIETCGPPQIQNTMLNQTKKPGEPAYFRCQIDMSKCMVAFIDWYHDSMNGSERRKVKSARNGDPHTHEISNVDPQHEGLYTCVVGNVLGRAEASAYLQVNSCSGIFFLNKGCVGIVMTVLLVDRLRASWVDLVT